MSVQSWDADQYAKNARFVAELGAPVVDLLAPEPGERILDLGCGDGALTLKLVQLGCDVVGVDSSTELVEAARRLGVDARVGDGERLEFACEFDAVFTNAALHWMKAPNRVIEDVYRALVPGGRFVGEFGGYGCVNAIRTALVAELNRRGVSGEAHVPWYFPTVGDYAVRLERGGFRVDSIVLIPRPTPLPGDMFGWLETFGQSFTRALPLEDRAEYLREVQGVLAPVLRDAVGAWIADYVRLRFFATKTIPRCEER